MNSFIGFLERCLLPIATKLSENKGLKAISTGFSVLLPIVMIGAVFTLLANLQIDFYQQAVMATHLKDIFAFAPSVTTDLLAIYAVFLIAKAYAEELNLKKDATICGLLALFAFLILIPLGVSGKSVPSGELVKIAAAISTGYLGAAGLFTAMILGLVIPRIYQFFIIKKIYIKMPDQVPPTIAKSFSAMLPGFAIAFLFGLARYGFSLTAYGTVNDFIYTLIKMPLSHLGASPLTFVILIAFCSILWFFGLHGGLIVMPFITAIYMPLELENLAAYGANADLPNIIVKSCWSVFASLGGAGGPIGLCIVMFFFAKSARYKTLSRIALPSTLCGISEPVTFGLPCVLNAIILIPMILAPIITFLIAYACMKIGLIPYLNGTTIPLGTPVILSAMLVGGWKTAVLQVVLILLQFVIYFPFFKVLDKQACQEEEKQVPHEQD